jgi:LuxR family maltose regulon positive regulatory protein
VLDRYCSSLCIAVFEGSDPEWTVRSCMDWLERGDLFVYALDDERIWYRYHHLFRDMLQAKARSALGVERWNELHRRAARWYAAQEMVNEGIHYALECEDMELASHLIEDGLCDALNREDRPTLEQWLHLIPEESFQGRPGLLLFKAWVLVLNWQREAGSRLLQQVEALLDGETLASAPAEQRSLWRGQVLAIRCQDAYFDNQHALAVALSREALELLPSSWTFARGAATMYNGFAMQAMGQGPAAERTLLDAYELAENKANSYAQRMLMALSMNYAMAGNLEQVAQVARVMLQQTTASRLGLLEGWAHYFLGYVAYQANDLDGASLHFAAILERRHTVHVAVVREAASLLALIHQARGAVAEADRVVEQLERADVELTGREDLSTAAVKAELMLRRGDVEGASRWADSIMEGPPNRPLVWLMQPHLTKARVLLARNLDTDAQDALQILDYLHDIAERSLNTRARIEILTLRALAMDALGNGGAAERDLQLAVELARPGGFVRVFVDGGARLEMLLGRLSKRGIAPATVRRIMAAFPDRKRGNGASAAIAIHGQNHSHFDTPLAEPLTEREMDILVQLCEPMSAKEIARALNVSPLTVKRHAANIYAKLGVNSRWDAVARARTLGILAPH